MYTEMIKSIMKVTVAIALLLIVGALAYGLIVDCPNTAGFVSCKYKI